MPLPKSKLGLALTRTPSSPLAYSTNSPSSDDPQLSAYAQMDIISTSRSRTCWTIRSISRLTLGLKRAKSANNLSLKRHLTPDLSAVHSTSPAVSPTPKYTEPGVINISLSNSFVPSDLERSPSSPFSTLSLCAPSFATTTATDLTSVDTDGAVASHSDSTTLGKDLGFKALWKKVKPTDKPDEGVPFDTDDAMFNPPIGGNAHASYHESNPILPPTHPTTCWRGGDRGEKDKDREGRHKDHRDHKDSKKSSRNRIIPLEEDIRRLFQECKIGLGNASLLSQALVHAKVEELKRGERGEVIKEFRLKCLSSQELIAAQIPWATAGADRSRREKERERQLLYGETTDSTPKAKEKQHSHSRDRTVSNNSLLADAAGIPESDSPIDEQTIEEKLLAALLEANGDLLSALGQYDDLDRVAQERKAEEKSRKETKMDRRAIAALDQQQQRLEEHGAGTGSVVNLSRSRSPSPVISRQGSRPSSVIIQHPLPQHPQALLTHPAQQHNTTQAPFDALDIFTWTLENRFDGMSTSRTPSPNTPSLESANWASGEMGGSVRDREILNELNTLNIDKGKRAWKGALAGDSDDEILTPIKPSAKALGKRRIEGSEEPEALPHPDDPYSRELGLAEAYDPYADVDMQYPPSGENFHSDSEDSESAYYPNGRPHSRNGFLHHLHHPPVHFVYDAAAERTQQRLREMEMQMEQMEMEKPAEVGNVH
ncbi:hypothetical protein D9757_003340 [Collybiopsis confluens]|uniref:Uncharacterized protein n=1 Tax=Collybiopsis confluens TaxID=2823264 RepID=A0A8H5HYW4_9AGAR|nr:hypothetical protein D9757_003340 [Collybiopsis confluens]